MRILLISSAFSGLTQRFYTELDDAGFLVSVELHLGDEARLIEGVELFQPDLILCPYLTRRLPEAIFLHFRCLIVHPGIKGDRGPSSLDWAIQQGLPEWGVTLLEADAEMDAGPIWASKTFPLRNATKSSVFNREVTAAAVDCLWEALTYFDAKDFKPEPLDYSRPDVRGKLQPAMKQADRALDWKKHKTADILRRINAADGSPGVLDDIFGQPFFLYNAQAETRLTGKPGEIIAIANQAICRATVDGAVWIGHLKAKTPAGDGIKLPAAMALAGLWPRKRFARPVKTLAIDYSKPGRQLPCQEVWYEIDGGAAYLYFPFHNGGMSTEQCRLLLSVYRHVAALDVKAIVLMGGETYWSNGIHLNHIEAAGDPAEASWENIIAMDDLVCQIVTTLDKLTVSAMAGNAGAGGAILALAADKVLVRDGVVLNPHYQNMGGLFGSEYWTYLLPKRVGADAAARLTEQCLPISAKKAWQLGLVDRVLDKQHELFAAQVKHLAHGYLADRQAYAALLAAKAATRCGDEARKPLAAYRKFELTQMYGNFYGDGAYHEARQCFVFKQAPKATPDNLCKHRGQQPPLAISDDRQDVFSWLDSYALGDEATDGQHRDLFALAGQLAGAADKETRLKAMSDLHRHVRAHFNLEEVLMKQADFQGYRGHVAEHRKMLDELMAMAGKIQYDECQHDDIQTFIGRWAGHITGADRCFSRYCQALRQELVLPDVRMAAVD